MKKVICLITVFILLFSTAYAEDEFLSVNDEGDIISAPVEKYILTQNLRLFEDTGARIIVATEKSTGELSVAEYAQKLYEELEVGSIGRKNSVFIFMCESVEDYHIIISPGISATLTEEKSQQILIDCMETEFAKGNYDNAIIKTFNAFALWYADKYGIEPDITEDMTEYRDIIRTENNERTLKTILIVILVILGIVAILWTVSYIRKRRRMDKLRKKRQERRKHYMRIG